MLATRLPNGMRMFVEEHGTADVAALYLWFNAGSRDEPPGLEGAAHVVEHMVFKGTASYGVGEVAAAVESLGGDINAWTSFDETCFHVTVPGQGAVGALQVLAEMGRSARFDPAELAREKEVIVEEIRGGEDDPDLVVSEALFAAAFPGDPYGRSIIGTPASVRGASRADLFAFYERNYSPANACLAVVGRVVAAQIHEAAARLFGGGGPAPARDHGPARARPGGARRRIRRKFAAQLAEVAFPAPAVGHSDLPALNVLATVLGGGSASMFDARVRREGSGCLDAAMQIEAEARGGLAVVSLAAEAGALGPTLERARAVLADAAAGNLAPEDVTRARARICAGRAFERETVDGRAHGICADSETVGDPEAWRAFDAATRAVTHADVVRVAAQYLRESDAIEVTLDSSRSSLTTNWPSPTRHARARGSFRLDNGVRVLLEPDEGDVVAIRAVGLGGGLAERAATSGRGALWGRTVALSAGGRDPAAYSRAIERLGGAVGASGGRSSQGLRADFPAEHAEAGLELFLDALLRPDFPVDEVDRARGDLLAAIEEKDDHPEQRVGERVWAASCPNHPWRLPAGGTRGGLRATTVSSVRRLHARWLQGENLVVSVAGGFDPDLLLGRLRGGLGRIPVGRWLPWSDGPGFPAEMQRERLRGPREQAHLAFAFPTPAIGDGSAPAAEVLGGVLGGQSGRLFVELREAHGLAYGVGATVLAGLQPSLMVVWMGTDPARLREAERRLGGCLDAIRNGAVSAEEVARAKTWLAGGWEVGMQTAAHRASEAAIAELYGLGGVEYRRAVQRIQRVEVGEVRAVAARMLARPLALVTMEPR